MMLRKLTSVWSGRTLFLDEAGGEDVKLMFVCEQGSNSLTEVQSAVVL